MEFTPVIGLEVHVQMKTETKMFCGCSTKFGAPPNTNVCPICLGMPGTLPVINKKAMEMAIKASLALNCKVEEKNIFARKNYFYPDLPKGYQISQYEHPLATKGHITIFVNGTERKIGITRLHVEEDAGKLIHGENLGDTDSSYVDLNRAGVPLMEIVSEPEIRSAEEAKAYLSKIRDIIEYLEVSDCNMEEGSLRCDANVSVMPKGSSKFGTKAEVKNMNSFRFLQKAVEYEIDRQIDCIENGGKVIQETRLFNPDKGITVSMRSKEEANDYRYFPDPDLLPVYVEKEWVDSIYKTLPELPDEKKSRFINDYKLPIYDAEVLTASKSLADYFERAVSKYSEAKTVSNWIMGDVLRYLNEGNMDINAFPVAAESLVELLLLIDNGTISVKIAKNIFEEMVKNGKSPQTIIKEKGLVQISDEFAIMKVIESIIENNKPEVENYKNGKDKVFGFFVGQVMRTTKGQANPQVVNTLLKKKLNDS